MGHRRLAIVVFFNLDWLQAAIIHVLNQTHWFLGYDQPKIGPAETLAFGHRVSTRNSMTRQLSALSDEQSMGAFDHHRPRPTELPVVGSKLQTKFA